MVRRLPLVLSVLGVCVLMGAYVWSIHTERSAIDTCKSDLSCLQTLVMQKVEHQGLDTALKFVETIYAKDPKFRPDCHPFMQTMGAVVYASYPNYRSLQITPHVAVCNYGFLQQYPQSILLGSGDTKETQNFCTAVASAVGAQVPGAEAECYRGVGRGLPFIDKTLWGNTKAMAALALTQCKELAPNESDYGVCVSGLFNALGREEIAKRYKLSINEKDPMVLCKEQTDSQARDHCFGNYKAVAVSLVDLNNFEGAAQKFETLYGANASSSVASAVWTLGYEWAHIHLVQGESSAQAINSCSLLSPAFAVRCIEGVSVGLAKHGVPWRQGDQVLSFCKQALESMSGIATSSCPSAQAIGYIQGMYSPQKFQEFCATLQKELNGICATGTVEGYGY